MASQAASAEKPKEATSSEVVPKQEKEHRKELYPMVNWKYDLFLYVMGNVADIFFREVVSRGSWKVPQSGPVLFVAGPHANQVRCPPHPDRRFHRGTRAINKRKI